MYKCQYRNGNECALLSKEMNPDSIEGRLMHINACQEEIIHLQGSVIDDLFNLTGMNAAANAEEMEAIIGKINEAAIKRAEI